jgi:hypothetical protein
MAYSDFTSLAKAKKAFDLTIVEEIGTFAVIPELRSSEALTEALAYNVPLATASNSEKARSELIIMPILLEVRKRLHSRFSLFSGVDFTVDEGRGLNGYCDYILSNSTEQLFVAAPVMMVVEAKNENLKGGLGQCVAEMVAAQIFNERENVSNYTIFGAVTTGTNWLFLQLRGKEVTIDLTEYYLVQIDRILGILTHAIVTNALLAESV